MESLVVTLETAKKLKAAGFPQDTAVITWKPEQWSVVIWKPSERRYQSDKEQLAAPTAQEIADQLRGYFIGRLNADNEPIAWYGKVDAAAPTMAEALALLWLKLQEGK